MESTINYEVELLLIHYYKTMQIFHRMNKNDGPVLKELFLKSDFIKPLKSITNGLYHKYGCTFINGVGPTTNKT